MSGVDMSEYRDAFAMERLIGSFGTGKAGALSLSLREKPYGVLLLDEFEKTTGDIMNLFLRIFDEGVFTDAEGRKVNAKNNIIIAKKIGITGFFIFSSLPLYCSPKLAPLACLPPLCMLERAYCACN